jgi:biopolymer transport protein ExbD
MHKKKAKPKLKEDISPNVVPMIDIMFLLLLFFMLGADMSQRESIEINIPKASAVPEPPKEDDKTKRTLVVNIHHRAEGGVCAVHDNNGVCREPAHWQWSMMGVDYPREEMKKQLQIVGQDYLEDVADEKAGKRLSNYWFLIRADQNAPYGDIQKVIEYAGTAGIYKVGVAANKPIPGT